MARLAGIALGVAMALVLTGCSVPRPLPIPTSSASETAGPTGDGVLRIGTLFPMSGDVASIGAGMVAAVEVAVRDVNAAGGVLGQPVEVFY
ncbi:ABC transporter substrate-binding protein, partial [Microcella sp.]|uniref:ABC transporter substrate-binding protein n=1 Tax=Microcella sp. TaxID=1913979 RepID=UPI00299F73FE